MSRLCEETLTQPGEGKWRERIAPSNASEEVIGDGARIFAMVHGENMGNNGHKFK